MHGGQRKHGMAMRGLVGALVVVAGLLVLSNAAHAVKPNPHGKQADQFMVLPTGDVLAVTKSTFLVWQQIPGTPGDTASNCDNGNACTWQEAVDYCAALGRGSRLAEVKELIGLGDDGVRGLANQLNTPNGPFSDVQQLQYWSAERLEPPFLNAWVVDFDIGGVDLRSGNDENQAWCVRDFRQRHRDDHRDQRQ